MPPFQFTSDPLVADEYLGEDISINTSRCDSDTELSEAGVENIGPVPRTIHQILMGALGVGGPGYIFTGGAILDPRAVHHVKRRTVSGGSMPEIVFVHHILALFPGQVHQLLVNSKGTDALIHPFLVNQVHHFGFLRR